MRFVLIRHGQSTNNALWAETGDDTDRELDARLTALGEAQAAAFAAYAVSPGLPCALNRDLFEVGGPYDLLDGSGDQVAHPGSGSSAIAALSDRVHLPDWLT